MKPKPSDFAMDQRVRYKPGLGTYGYEDCLDADGRIGAVVIGHTPTRVRIRFARGVGLFLQRTMAAVDPASLVAEAAS